MALLKCPVCGKEAEEGRFYCASCGGELQPTNRDQDLTLRPPLKFVRDIDSRLLTVVLMGIAVCIAGFIAYAFGQTWGRSTSSQLPLPIMGLGLCMIAVGFGLNWSQGLPGAVRLAISVEFASAAIALAVGLALIMEVTSWVNLTDDGHLIKVALYDHRPAGMVLEVPFVLGALGVAVAMRQRVWLAWPSGLILSLANIPLAFMILPGDTGDAVPVLLAALQIAFLIALFTRPARMFLLKGRPLGGGATAEA